MRNTMRTLYILILFTISLTCCSKDNSENKEILFTDYMEWWKYYNNEIHLSSNFQALGSKENEISKKQFLDSLKTGNYLPIKHQSKTNTYYLQKNKSNNESITSTIKQVTEIQLFNLSWEGKEIPEFNFTDLSGNNYTKENTKNKTVLLKTYYTNCQACNKEMPELNKFVAEKHSPNVIFLSLALDDEKKLKNYLKNKHYKYHFVPDQEEFIRTKLESDIFPTYFVIENGIIRKVVNDASELIVYMKNK